MVYLCSTGDENGTGNIMFGGVHDTSNTAIANTCVTGIIRPAAGGVTRITLSTANSDDVLLVPCGLAVTSNID